MRTYMIYKRCSICGKRIPTGTTCSCLEQIRKARQKDYDQNRRNKKNHSFYTSKAWIRTRDYTIQLYDGIDIYLYYETGQVVKADVVHHIIPLSDDFDLRFSSDNLIPLSHASHNYIHDVYDKSETEKLELEARLKNFLKRYRSENVDSQ